MENFMRLQGHTDTGMVTDGLWNIKDPQGLQKRTLCAV